MRRRTPLVVATALALLAIGAPFWARDRGASTASASTPDPAKGPAVAILATMPGAEVTSLYITTIGSSTLPAPVATLSHAPDAAVRASVLPGTSAVLAIVDSAPLRDLSFAASLVRVEPHTPSVTLCDRVVHSSRPLVTPGGRVFVARGTAGLESTQKPLTMRVDALAIDEIDPASGAARTIHTFAGQLTFLAGFAAGEVLVYRIGSGGADLVGIDPDSGAVRPILASLLPFARDFSVDDASHSLVLEDRSETDSARWVIDSVDLVHGARTRLYEGSSYALAPHVWPGGAVAYTPDGHRGLALTRGALLPPPLGDGVDLVLDVESGGGAVALLHTDPGKLAVPYAITIGGMLPKAIPAPPGARVTIAGFFAGTK